LSYNEFFLKNKFKHSKKLTPIRTGERSKIVREKGIVRKDALRGVITASMGRIFLVEVELDSKPTLIECQVAGRVISPHKRTSIAAVGDDVLITFSEHLSVETGLQMGQIVAVEERRNTLSRKAAGKAHSEQVIAANLDYVIIFVASVNPAYNKKFIDRILVASEREALKPIICVNKVDLADAEDLDIEFEVYRNLGYSVHFVSAENNINISAVLDEISGSVSALVGPSGVGKSTFINSVLGKEVQDVKAISDRTLKGAHTTSFVRMFKLINGGRIIDSPGVREFGIWHFDKNELALYFHEFDNYTLNCKYPSCSHLHEPECAVIEALELGEIDFERYESYVNLFHTLEEYKSYS